jgi:hypothetical protein
LAVTVVVLDEVVDSGDQVFDAPETASANRLLSDEPKAASFKLLYPNRPTALCRV